MSELHITISEHRWRNNAIRQLAHHRAPVVLRFEQRRPSWGRVEAATICIGIAAACVIAIALNL